MLKGLLSDGLTAPQYGTLLQSMLAFYRPLESELVPGAAALLARHPHPNPDYRYRPRAPLLADDCRALGLTPNRLHDSPQELRLERGPAYLLGVLYVVEGSTQGGRLIARHLSSTLGVGEHSGASFFNMHRSGNFWMAFRHWLDSGLAGDYRDDVESITEGADMTFSALRVHLERWERRSVGD